MLMSGGSFLVLRTSQCQARQPRCRFAGFATTVLRKQLDGGWEAPIGQFFRSIGVGTGTPGTSSRRTGHAEVRRRRIVITGLPTIQELSFVAGRIEKPSAGISKDRLSLRHWAATQANPLRMLRIATPSDAI